MAVSEHNVLRGKAAEHDVTVVDVLDGAKQGRNHPSDVAFVVAGLRSAVINIRPENRENLRLTEGKAKKQHH